MAKVNVFISKRSCNTFENTVKRQIEVFDGPVGQHGNITRHDIA